MSDTDPEPDLVDSVFQDDSEDEVFFGQVSEKEKTGKNSVFTRRRTLTMSDSDRRRSFEDPQTSHGNGSFEVPHSRLGNGLFDSIGSRCSSLGDEGKNGMDDGFFTANESLEKVSLSIRNEDNMSGLEFKKDVEENKSKYKAMNYNNNGKRFESDIGHDVAHATDSEIKSSLAKTKIHEVRNHPPFSGLSVPPTGDISSPDCFQPARNLRLRLSTDDFQSSFEEDSSHPACFRPKKDFSMDGSHSIAEPTSVTDTFMSQKTEPTNGLLQTNNIIGSQLNQEESLSSDPPASSESLLREESQEADDSLLIGRKADVSNPINQEVNHSWQIHQDTVYLKPIHQETKDSQPMDQETIDSQPIDQETGDSQTIDQEVDGLLTIIQKADDLVTIDQEADNSQAIDQEADNSQAINLEADDLQAIDQEADESQAIDQEADDLQAIDQEADESQAIDQEADERQDSQAVNQQADDLQVIDQEADHSQAIHQQADDLQAIDQEADESQAIDQVADERQDSQAIDQQADHSQAIDQQADHSQAIDQQADDSQEIDQQGDHSQAIDQKADDSQVIHQEAHYSKAIDEEIHDTPPINKETKDLQPINQETGYSKPIYQETEDSHPIDQETEALKPIDQETDDSQTIVQENLSADFNSHDIVKEILATICIPIISKERLSTDNSTPIVQESLSTELVSQTIMKESLVTDFVLPASHLGEGSSPTDFLPLASKESLSSDEMPPVIENYLTENSLSETGKEDRISSNIISQLEGSSSSSVGASSKITSSSGSTLEIERNGSRSLTDQLKISSSNFFNISRSSATVLSIEPVEELSSDRNTSEMSLSEKSLIAPRDINNFLSSTSDGHHLIVSPNTIADGLSPESRERMYSSMEDSNGDISCDGSVFSNESSDGLPEDVAKYISVHKEHDEDAENADVSQQEKSEDNLVQLKQKEAIHDHNESDKCLSRDIVDSENGDDRENCLEEILDVDNDQLFDDSLFSMNDKNSRRISTIGKNICKKWKKKEKKSKENHESAISVQENSEILHTIQSMVQESSPKLRDDAPREESPQFDNTADEMSLYEMFGQDYDKTVENMTIGEKKELREKLDSRTEEDLLLTKSNLSILMDVSLPVSPDVLNVCTDGNKSLPTVETNVISKDLILPKSPIRENLVVIENHCFAQPEPSTKLSPNDLVSIVSSEQKRVTPSPSVTCSNPWSSSSPHRKSLIPTPVSGGLRPRTPLSSARTPGSSANSKVSTNLRQVEVNPSPLLGTRLRATSGVSPSPLAAYLRDNKPPPLVHQVKAQSAVRDLESTLYEVDDETTEYVCPLPEAVYSAPGLAKEHVTDATNKDYNIAEAYGQTNTVAKVTRHVGRVKTSGIHWGEELATDQSMMSSPSHCQMLPVGKSVLKKTQRDSGTFDESMMDVSVLETVAVKKIGRRNNKK